MFIVLPVISCGEQSHRLSATGVPCKLHTQLRKATAVRVRTEVFMSKKVEK